MRMNIVFCFDENMMYPACVAIASLLDSKLADEHFDIYCVCSGQAVRQTRYIRRLAEARDEESRLVVCEAPHLFDGGYEIRGISSSCYLRLNLHRILEDLDKVIYCDVDVLFKGALSGMWNTDMGTCLLAGVIGSNNFHNTWEMLKGKGYAGELEGLHGKYINSGVLLMNLNAIRLMNPDHIWLDMSKKQYHYQDQDILNITCKGRILFLPLKYNVAAHLTKKDFRAYAREGMYTKKEQDEAWNRPQVLHYAGEKPWNNRGTHKAAYWWDYVDSQADLSCLFDKHKIRNRKNTGLIGKINRHLPW